MIIRLPSARGLAAASPVTSTSSRRRLPHWLRRTSLALVATLAASTAGFAVGTPEISVEQPAGTVLGSRIVAWGGNSQGQTTVPSGLTGVVSIVAASTHTVALKSNGAVIAWGDNGSGQTTVPVAAQSDVVGIAAGYLHTVALKSDGSVLAWGANFSGQLNVPVDAQSDVKGIAGGFGHTVALKNDGTVVAWGYNFDQQATVPGGLTDVVAIAAGDSHTLALKSDGTVVAWGATENDHGQATVPPGLTGVTAIAAGAWHSLALKSDGTVVAWGRNSALQTDIPAGLGGVEAIAAGDSHSVALKSDGTVVAWGLNDDGQTTVPVGLTGMQAIAAGYYHTVALATPVVAFGSQSLSIPSAPKTFTIKNTGSAALIVSGVSLVGANASDFSVSTTGILGSVPATTGETTFTVTFTPTATGLRTTTLRVASDDTDEASYDIPLSGTGFFAPTINAFTTARESIFIDVLDATAKRTVSAPIITVFSQPNHGTATVVDGKIRFTPTRSLATGGDTFTYQIDRDGEITVGRVQIVNLVTTAGDYDGLISNGEGLINTRIAMSGADAHERSGHLRVNVSRLGSFTGVITFAGVEIRTMNRAGFRGVGRGNRFGVNGTETFVIKRPPLAPITVELAYDVKTGTILASATTENTHGDSFTSTGVLAPRGSAGAAAGRYTMRFEPAAPPPPITLTPAPQGRGFAAVKIESDGVVRIAGKLADGSSFTSGTYLHEDGSFPVYGELYRGALDEKGSVRGTVNVYSLTSKLAPPPGRSSDAFGNFAWFKSVRNSDGHFPGGFDLSCSANCWRYERPARGVRVLSFDPGTGNGRLLLHYGGVGELDQDFTLAADNRAIPQLPNGNRVTLDFDLASGLFRGTFVHPGNGRRTTFHGAVSQSERTGFGYFLGSGPTDGGLVEIWDNRLR